MNISNITPPQVWTSSSRSLTNFGSGALAQTSTVNTVLAGAASVDLRPSNGVVALNTIVVVTGVAATQAIQIQVWDGTTAYTFAITAAGASAQAAGTLFSTNGVGARVFNSDATHAGSYEVAGISLTI